MQKSSFLLGMGSTVPGGVLSPLCCRLLLYLTGTAAADAVDSRSSSSRPGEGVSLVITVVVFHVNGIR